MAKKKQKNTPQPLGGASQPDPQKPARARAAFRKTREALGLSQQQLATELGTSVALIQGIESGNRPVSEEVSKKIQARLGVFRESVEGDSSEPLTLLHEPVSKDAVLRVTNDPNKELSETEISEYTKPLMKLIRAAVKDGKLLAFGKGYRDMLIELKENVRLGPTLTELLRPMVRMTRKQLRNAPGFKSEWDDPLKPDDEEVLIPVPTAVAGDNLFEEPKLIPDFDRGSKEQKKSAASQPGK